MKKIALINDLSGFGRCSLTAAIPVISAMGIQACPLPTAILSSQTGFSSYFCDDYTDKMDIITSEWKKLDVTFDGIHSGYLASPLQLQKVISFLDAFQTPDTIYLADPVMGDHGKKIKSFSSDLLDGMRQLVNRATICTPNLTELCLLTGTDYDCLHAYSSTPDYIERITELAHKLLSQHENQDTCFSYMETSGENSRYYGCHPTILITGIIRQKADLVFVGNLAVTSESSFYVESPFTGVSYSGTGDLFASIICGSLVSGLSLEQAMHKAVDFLQPAIEEASLAQMPGCHGIPFEKYIYKLAQ